jgi:hypothetical protein
MTPPRPGAGARDNDPMEVLLFLPLPVVLIAGWLVMWHFRSPGRWAGFFAAGLALMLLLVAGFALRSHQPCTDSGLACADDYGFFVSGNLLAGCPTWLLLLVVTTIVEVALRSRPSPEPGQDGGEKEGDDEPYDRYGSMSL